MKIEKNISDEKARCAQEFLYLLEGKEGAVKEKNGREKFRKVTAVDRHYRASLCVRDRMECIYGLHLGKQAQCVRC